MRIDSNSSTSRSLKQSWPILFFYNSINLFIFSSFSHSMDNAGILQFPPYFEDPIF